MTDMTFTPGSLVRARGREWIVLNGSNSDVLQVRPVSGSEEDRTVIHLALEPEPVREASFQKPLAEQRASQDAALLLRDALLLSLRRGAGPFRGFGQIAVEPRAYQLVPLLMALKLDPVRLLIADDVGVGKTIEAALIARELIDRGEVDRFTVLCPPHLVEQWVSELSRHFNLHAVPVTAGSAARLERNLPAGESIFSTHLFTVVSLDYIKNQRRREEFVRACPEFVIVDEAHTCAAGSRGKHLRYELLKELSANKKRNLLLLTATPHSGDEEAFYHLLGLLHEKFLALGELRGDGAQKAQHDKLRDELAAHFVQRRRVDLKEWEDDDRFPRRESVELTYKLTGEWDAFLQAVLDYCAAVVDAAGTDERRQRLNFWGTLALMRCVGSSPAAAMQALRTRAGLEDGDSEEENLLDRVLDGSSDALSEDDLEPAADTGDPALAALIAQAEKLVGQAGDPKLKKLTEQLQKLLSDGYHPVVFCRYIATAKYLGEQLATKFKGVTVGVITGEATADERKQRADLLGEAQQRLLIATDCLSEGINLQHHFDAVVHYDLSWNPTRHEQREGRVDRFGQSTRVVRTTLIYGANNPVDGAVLEVILRKAEKIRKELGVPVPLPDAGQTLTQALLKAVLLKRNSGAVGLANERAQMKLFDDQWTDVAEKTKKNHTKFAQRSLRAEDVLPEWQKSLEAIGSERDVERFAKAALARLGAPMQPVKQGYKVSLDGLPLDVRERLEAEGLTGAIRVSFSSNSTIARPITRSHSLITVLAETLLERTLDSLPSVATSVIDPGVLGRVGCWVSAEVTARTVIVLMRLRHQLTTGKRRDRSTLLVEEATALAWSGTNTTPLQTLDALKLLTTPAVADPPPHVRDRQVREALALLDTQQGALDSHAIERAASLLADHQRVQAASKSTEFSAVKAIVPADVMGVYVLLPKA
jgi:superfamily II DNA or RNA helicase